jgi:hypothetical protein
MKDRKPRKTKASVSPSHSERVALETVTKKRRRKSLEPCPKCGSLDVVPILYGYPGPGMMEAAEQGKIALGGCCVGDRDPLKQCKACGEEFDLPPARTARRVRLKK